MSVINYAHRGASEYYPENTLYAFYAGLEMGADGIETDIQRTKDGVLVLHHDDTLERVAGKDGHISDYTYAELMEMDFGAFKDEKFVGERIVTLETFLDHFGRKPLTVALEIKQGGIEAEVIECIRRHPCRAKLTLTSFLWESVLASRQCDRDIEIGFLTERITPRILDELSENGIRQICPRADLTDPTDMALARSRGLSVRFWGIKDEATMLYALSLKGDGMTVNFPDRLTRALRV